MTNYTMQFETGRFHTTFGTVRGILASGWTGRRVDVEAGYGPAGAWLDHCETSELPHEAYESQFLREIADREPQALDGPLFRGRYFPANLTPASEEFGPPPADLTRAGRYHVPGSPKLYLCSSLAGVASELTPPGHEHQLWIQRFQSPRRLVLLDAGTFRENSLAAAAFWRVESQRDRELAYARLGPRLAAIASERFDGMIVPGVRSADEPYFNVVLFRPEPVWRDLLDCATRPSRAA
jgi:hypothetical protein